MYPKFQDRLHLQELRRFTLSLGMQRDSLLKFVKPMFQKNDEVYYSVSSLHGLLNNKTANQVLHRTFNVYSAEYNTQVIRKALLLIMSRRITLDELQELRSLFEAYESEDLEGMVANEQTVFRLLKHCGRSIAPLKLQHQMKKMRDVVDTAGRLQFYEFLEVVPLTNYIKDVSIQDEFCNGTEKDGQKLYKIDDFYTFLFPRDEKVKTILDKEYKRVISRRLTSDQETLAKSQGKEKQINNMKQASLEKDSKDFYRKLKDTLKCSKRMMSLSKSGVHKTKENHPELLHKVSSSMDGPAMGNIEVPLNVDSALLQPIITTKDIDKQCALIEDLEWQMLNNTEKYQVSVQKTLEELKLKKKFRDSRNMFSKPTNTRRTVDLFGPRVSRPSTVTDALTVYSTFEDDTSMRTKLTSSGTIDLDDLETGDAPSPPFQDVALSQDYQLRRQYLLEKAKVLKQGGRLVDI